MGKSSAAFIVFAVFAMAACEPSTSPKVSEESAAKVLLPAEQIFESRVTLDDIVERLLPSIGDAQAETSLRIELAAFSSNLAGGNRPRARASLNAAQAIVDDLAERTSSGKSESPDVSAIRIALVQAEASLQKLEKLQADNQQ